MACLIAGACGCVFALPWLFESMWWATWIAFIVFFGTIHQRSPKLAFFCGFFLGLGAYAVGFCWLPPTLTVFGGFSYWVAILISFAYCAYGALRFALFAWLGARYRQRHEGAVLVFPIVWVALELVWFEIFPWRLGHSQYPLLPLIQIAEVAGVFGVSFMVMWGCVVVHDLARWLIGARFGSASPPSPPWRNASRYALALALVVVFGLWRLHSMEETIERSPKLRVALVQPNVGVRKTRLRMETCRRLTEELPSNVDLICWPESSVGTYPLKIRSFKKDPLLFRGGRRLPRPLPNPATWVLCTGLTYAGQERASGIRRGTAFLFDREETIIGRYHKRVLLPFGEYIPGESWFPSWHRFLPFKARYVPGTSSEPLAIPGGARLGVLICYEDVLPGLARSFVKRGADILVNLTNDAWFGESPALREHQMLALFRAIENRRYLLRCTNTGSTAIIAPTGKIAGHLPRHKTATLVRDVHTLTLITFYSRFGDVFGWGCVVAAVLALLRRSSASTKRSGTRL